MANKAQVNYVGSQAIVTVNNGGDRVNQSPAELSFPASDFEKTLVLFCACVK